MNNHSSLYLRSKIFAILNKKILIVTERRADYSKFRPIIKEIEKSKKMDYCLVVTGSHLLKEYGNTINQIKQDKFKISSKFHMYPKNNKNTNAEMVRSFAKAVNEISKIVEKIKPNIILAGFDIGANFAAAIIGAHMNIVVAHLEGGEVTGTIDESIRHATTKFSHIHFVTNSEAAKRIIKMGENPKLVFVVGNPSLDSIKNIKKISKEKLEKKFELDFSKPYVIILQHTVTSEIETVDKNIKKTIDAIKESGIQSILIYGNADAGSRKISKIIKNSKIKQFSALSFDEYMNLLKNSAALIGNSSSGIMEAPYWRVPSSNIGSRQSGRLRSSSVINVEYDKNKIKNAVKKAINDKKFLAKIKNTKNLYGNGNASKNIVSILEKIDLKKIPIQKKMEY